MAKNSAVGEISCLQLFSSTEGENRNSVLKFPTIAAPARPHVLAGAEFSGTDARSTRHADLAIWPDPQRAEGGAWPAGPCLLLFYFQRGTQMYLPLISTHLRDGSRRPVTDHDMSSQGVTDHDMRWTESL